MTTDKPSKLFRDIFNENVRRGQIIGCNSPDGRIFTPRLIFVLATGVLGLVMEYNGFSQHRSSIPHICSLLVVTCLIIVLLIRLGRLLFSSNQQEVVSFFESTVQLFQQEEQNSNHRHVLNVDVKILRFINDSYLNFCFMISFIPNPTAWIVSFYTDEFIQVAPFYLPFINPQSLIGYIINSTLIVYYCMLLYVCYTATDIAYIFIVFQFIPWSNIYCMKFIKFGEDLLKVKATDYSVKLSTSNVVNQRLEEQKRAQAITQVEQQIITFIKEFNTYNEHVNTTLKFMELTTFVSMLMNSFAIGMAIVVVLTYSRAVGAVLVVFLTFQALIPCVLGALISHQKEKLCNELNSFPWYELTLAKQKIFLQFFHLVQNSNELQLPIIGMLNMELFTDIINRAYSFFMYLIKFVKL